MLELDTKVELEIIDLAITHIKKVNLNPEVKTEGDNFDYWNSFKLDDDNYIDYNVYMGDDCGEINTETGEFEYGDSNKWSWDCSAFRVDPPNEENKHHQTNTNVTKHLLNYKNGEMKQII
jgi:hypothetical protein